MKISAANMVTRQISAEARFVSCVINNGFTADEAAIISRVFVHIGILKFDAVDGQFYIRHGGFMDAHVMRNALDGADDALASKKVVWRRR